MTAIIGISTSTITIKRPEEVTSFQANYTPRDFSQAIERAGGLPFLLPICQEDLAKDLVRHIDGLVLTGGHDLSPHLYKQEPRQSIGEILPDRDQFEMALLSQAIKQGKPVLGICRGLQLINVYYGGTLYQDLSENEQIVLQHNQRTPGKHATHQILIEANTRLEQILEGQTMVNSFHHQAINQLGQGLQVSARSNDQVIEAIEAESDNILAVQWHPELSIESNPASIKLFEDLVNRAHAYGH